MAARQNPSVSALVRPIIMDSDWAVFVEDNVNKNITSRREQSLIQVLIYLFITTCDYDEEEYDDDDDKETRLKFQRGRPTKNMRP